MQTVMTNQPIEKHQLAGLDARARGFTRLVAFEQMEAGYRAVFRYESARFITEGRLTSTEALQELVHLLQAKGYSQLRSQQSYRNGTYLGSQEPWIEYPDPERPPEPTWGLFGRFRRWWWGQ